MVKTLTKHGNSYALVLDKAILDLLKITPETPLELSIDSGVLHISRANQTEAARKEKIAAAYQGVNRRYSAVFKKLAE